MKILMISYYSLPLNSVSSYRIHSFCKYFSLEGAEITLITRHWGESFTSWSDILATNKTKVELNKNENFRVVRLPYISKKNIQTNKFQTFADYLLGNLQPEIDAFANFKKYSLELLINENDFDLIFVSAPPNNLVRLAHYLNKKTGVPYVVDFRDFFNFNYLIKDSHIKFNDRIVHQLSIFHLKRWLKNCSQIITVSPKLTDICAKTFGVKTSLVPNGFEAERFRNNEDIYSPNNVFTIRYLGTAYSQQDFTMIIKGLQTFQKKHPEKLFKIELIGLHSEKTESLFVSQFDEDVLDVQTDRISKKEVVEKTINTDVLMLPWNNFQSVFGTKVFDYIASGSHILLAPSDNDVVHDLIKSLNAGTICYSKQEVYECLNDEYEKWKSKKNKRIVTSEVYKFSREKIAREFYSQLKKEL